MMELQKKYPDLTLMPYGNKRTAQPKVEWLQEIVGAADKAGIPVFLKDNLAPLLAGYNWEGQPSKILVDAHKSMLRQEFPK